MSTPNSTFILADTLRDRSRDWNRQHIELWVDEARRLRNAEMRRILSSGIGRVASAIDALIIAPLTRGRMLPKQAFVAAGRDEKANQRLVA